MSATRATVGEGQGGPEAESVFDETHDVASTHNETQEGSTPQGISESHVSDEAGLSRNVGLILTDRGDETDGQPDVPPQRSDLLPESSAIPSTEAVLVEAESSLDISSDEVQHMSDSDIDESKDAVSINAGGHIFMHHDRRESKDPDAPDAATGDTAVLWAAKVFDSGRAFDADIEVRRRGSDPSPTVTYFDDRPLTLSELPRAENVEEQTQSERPPSWSGAVFKIEITIQTSFDTNLSISRRYNEREVRFSFSEASSRRAARRANRKPRVPKEIRSLKIERKSRSRIAILSPFIYRSLTAMVGYYPSFYEKEAGFLTDLKILESPVDASHFSIYEPYPVLMHNFPKIQDFVNKTPENLQAQASPVLLDERDRRSYTEAIVQLQRQHMRHLYQFLKPLHDARVIPYQRYLSEPVPRVAFEMLWYLFKPGTDVYVRSDGMLHACVVADVRSNFDYDGEDQNPGNSVKYWVLDVWYLDTNGYRIGRVSTHYQIEAYSGLSEVTKLFVCPVSIWDASDSGERRRKILNRSRILVKSLKQSYLLVNYNGATGEGGRRYAGAVVIDHQRGFAQADEGAPRLGRVKDYCSHFKSYDRIFVNTHQKLDEAWLNQAEDDQVKDRDIDGIIVRETYRDTNVKHRRTRRAEEIRYEDSSSVSSLDSNSTDEDGPEPKRKIVQAELDERQLLLLYPQTRGFALKTKQWMKVNADFISEISGSAESIANLVIGEDELKTIRALSNRQSSKNEIWAADFIEGKGTGQIILLHGPPGVGKTFSVEAIAEWLRRPLLALTVADIGTAETRIEAELVKWFSLAEAWNAVLLVDEADVFLERRQNRDLARNGLVSAFLRRMEYFKGLLFLTTNRVGQIDDAFISRVHVAIGYKPLSAESRQKIWNGFFRKLVKDRAGRIQIAPDAKKWVLKMAETGQAQLNGRDIRNALQTAITLAESDCEEDPDFDPKETIVVTQSHFQRVLEISNKFHEYVASIRREDEKKRAAGRGDRNDYGDVSLESLQLR